MVAGERSVMDVVDAIARTIRGCRFRYSSEDELQQGLAQALTEAGFGVEREVRLDSHSRLDLLVGRVAVEVKVAGPARGVRAQVDRYLLNDRLDGLVLVTSRVRHVTLPRESNGKPIVVVELAGVGL
jgi:hypothetical protein